MKDFEEAKQALLLAFPKSFINDNNEFIAEAGFRGIHISWFLEALEPQ